MTKGFCLFLIAFLTCSCPAFAGGGYEREREAVLFIPRQGEADLVRQRLHKVFLKAQATVTKIMNSGNPHIAGWWLKVKNSPPEKLERLHYINKLTNDTIPYRSDYSHSGKGDDWAIPLVTLTEGGDCEDLAILKGMALYRTGWPLERLHILVGYVNYKGKKTAHAVLMADTGRENMILDSLKDYPEPFTRYAMIPVYMIGAEGTKIFPATARSR